MLSLCRDARLSPSDDSDGSLASGEATGYVSGDRLICVRYRYDPQREKRLKTVELLVAERDWEPSRPPCADNQMVGMRIAFAEAAVRERAKQAGGKWNPDRKVWELRYREVVALKLATRIVKDNGIQ